MRHEIAIPMFDKRDERLSTLTDESCRRLLQLHHVPGLLPEPCMYRNSGETWSLRCRFMAGCKSYLRAGSGMVRARLITKEKVRSMSVSVSMRMLTKWFSKLSQGALEDVSLYSIMEKPMTSCGCFECICGIEPFSNGVCHRQP